MKQDSYLNEIVSHQPHDDETIEKDNSKPDKNTTDVTQLNNNLYIVGIDSGKPEIVRTEEAEQDDRI